MQLHVIGYVRKELLIHVIKLSVILVGSVPLVVRTFKEALDRGFSTAGKRSIKAIHIKEVVHSRPPLGKLLPKNGSIGSKPMQAQQLQFPVRNLLLEPHLHKWKKPSKFCLKLRPRVDGTAMAKACNKFDVICKQESFNAGPLSVSLLELQ
jgi:hypothetical protein